MNSLRLMVLGAALGIVALVTPAVRAQIVHTGADTDTKIRIGYPNYQHEELHHSCAMVFYCESHRHSWLPSPGNWAAQAEAHAKRFHMFVPFYGHIEWQSVWGGGYLRNGYNPKSAKHKEAAWGSMFVVAGPPGELAELRARIPAENLYDPLPEGIPPQGMYADSFFDVFFDIDLSVDVPGGGSVNMMAISGSLAGPAAVTPGLTFTAGDWAAPFFDVADTVSPSGRPRKLTQIASDILSPTTVFVPTNTPFHVDWSQSLESEVMSDEELPDGVIIGTAAAIGMHLELVDQSGRYDLRPVPEPATVVLLMLGAAVLALRRRGN